MVNVNKSELQCQLWNKILKNPVHLPCHCTICHAHLTDGSAKDGRISCVSCGENFEVKDMQFKVNNYAKFILDAESHLSPKEKADKSKMQNSLNEFQQLFDELQQSRLHLRSFRTSTSLKLSVESTCSATSQKRKPTKYIWQWLIKSKNTRHYTG